MSQEPRPTTVHSILTAQMRPLQAFGESERGSESANRPEHLVPHSHSGSFYDGTAGSSGQIHPHSHLGGRTEHDCNDAGATSGVPSPQELLSVLVPYPEELSSDSSEDLHIALEDQYEERGRPSIRPVKYGRKELKFGG